MLVTLNKSSWHVKYYYWVTGNNPTFKFRSICPYFWTMVLYIISLPLILLWKIFKFLLVKSVVVPMMDYVDKKLEERSNKPKKEKPKSKFSLWWNRNSEKIGEWILNIWVVIFVCAVIGMLGVLFYDSTVKNGLLVTIVFTFAIIGFFATVLCIMLLVSHFIESDLWSSIKGILYSFKHKVCPMITWK